MDKRTIIAVTILVGVMLGTQVITNKIFPPIPAKAKPTATFGTNATSLAAAAATNAVEASKLAAAATPVFHRPTEQTVTISNDLIRVEFTSWGGGIKSVELVKHHAHDLGNTVLNGTNVPPALRSLLPGAATDVVFTVEQTSPGTVVMRGGGVTKTLSLGKSYLMEGRIDLTPEAAAGQTNITLTLGTIAPASPKEAPNYLNVDWQGGPKWSNRDVSLVTKRAKAAQNRETLLGAHWAAVKSQYFAMIVSSPTNITEVSYEPYTLPLWPDSKEKIAPVGIDAAVQLPLVPAANGTASCSFTYYAGPKDYNLLLALGQHQEEAMDFGSWMDGYTGIFGLVLFWGLNFFYGIVHSYGVAIILVTIAIKLLFWPIQAKSIKSMKAMQKFQPQIQKLKEKYKDDQARMSQETMKLYKEHKINPLAGCLPMLVQMPVLFGFYKLLVCDIALRGASFLWIKDLAQPDTVAVIGGIALNPLPLLMTASSILQQKLTPTTGDPQQAKMMMFMPLIMLFMFYNLAAGLTLYYTLQQLLSVLQQWLALRHEKKTAPATAAVVTGKSK